jgi:uracil-DNA glycosylase
MARSDDHDRLVEALRARLESEKWFGVTHLPVEKTSAGITPQSSTGTDTPHGAARIEGPNAADRAATVTATRAQSEAAKPTPKPGQPLSTPPAASARHANALPARPPPEASPQSAEKESQLAQLQKEGEVCDKCALRANRTHFVFGEGNPDAEIMFIGEAPGADEDRTGRPFVGRAGQLLTKIIEAMGLRRQDVYIANICKCRPPENRAPEPSEMACCVPFLLKQIEIIKPKIIVAMGRVALQGLFDTSESITRVRGIFREYKGIRLMPTFHPSYLLHNPPAKSIVWDDMKKVIAELDRLNAG